MIRLIPQVFPEVGGLIRNTTSIAVVNVDSRKRLLVRHIFELETDYGVNECECAQSARWQKRRKEEDTIAHQKKEQEEKREAGIGKRERNRESSHSRPWYALDLAPDTHDIYLLLERGAINRTFRSVHHGLLRSSTRVRL